MIVDPRLKQGFELFNRREFFESHEVVESLWRAANDEYRDFYKGLIQAAAAFHHLRRGKFSAARGLFETSIGYLSGYSSPALGLNLDKLVRDLTRCLRMIPELAQEKGRSLPKAFIPTLEFCVD